MRQLTINTFVGIGGKNYQAMAKVAGANLGLNTANNLGTSFIERNFSEDAPMNTGKIILGILGGAIGVGGANIFTGTILPSIYSNGTDAYLNNVNDKYYRR